jgi:hypothetical protein
MRSNRGWAAAGRAGVRASLGKAPARVACETKRDQDQVVEIPHFRVQRTGKEQVKNRADQVKGELFAASKGLRAKGVSAAGLVIYIHDSFLQGSLPAKYTNSQPGFRCEAGKLATYDALHALRCAFRVLLSWERPFAYPRPASLDRVLTLWASAESPMPHICHAAL